MMPGWTLELGQVWPFESLPPRTLALDGAVQGPHVDPQTERYSFDHHGGCVRLCTTATCRQVLDAMLLGLDPSGYHVLINDVDADTVLSLWLLRSSHRWRSRENLRKVLPLVEGVGSADCHGQAYPLVDPGLSTFFHKTILAPLADFKRGLASTERATAAMNQCLDLLESWWRQDLRVAEEPSEEGAEGVTVEPKATWVLATSAAVDFRTCSRLYRDGHDRLVLYSPTEEPGHYRFTLAKRSDLVGGFPLGDLFHALNDAEQRKASSKGQAPGGSWGGGTTIGGSPRPMGSILTPAEVAAVIESVLEVPGRKG